MFDHAKEALQYLLEPIGFMFYSSLYLPGTVLSLLSTGQFSTLLSPSAFKYAWFARFWAVFGPLTKQGPRETIAPLMKLAKGVVVEIGPGGGEWIDMYDKEKVTKIYGVEPNKDHHERLRKRVKELGLSDVYEIVPVGVEDLGTRWVQEGEVDSIVTVQCLCSVSNPKAMIKSLYGYLKPGGQWIVYEHVITHVGGLVAWYQWAIDFIWPHFLGGCSITRDSEKWLKETGTWSKVDLKQPDNESSYMVLPHVMGTLTK